MNKIFTTSVLAISLALCAVAPVQAQTALDLFNMATTNEWPTVNGPKYKIDMKGYDVRAYEWRSVSDPNVLCIAIFPKAGPGFTCIDTSVAGDASSEETD